MFVTNCRYWTCLIVLIQHVSSTPLSLDSSDDEFNPESPFYTPETMAETVYSNDAGLDAAGGLSFFDDGSSSNIDSTFFLPTQVYDDIPLTSYDLTYSDLGASCPLEGIQSGEKCEASQELLSMQSLEFFDDLHSDTNKLRGGFGAAPCSVGYHLCCKGPTGSYAGMIYDRIEQCSFGTIPHDVVLALASQGC